MSARAPRAESHVPELDGVRGIAILMVMGLHFLCALAPAGQLSRFEFLTMRLTGYGAWGVDLFFVLSGYLITGILWKSRGNKHYFRSFYARRTLRIFPLYYGILFILTVLLPASLLRTYVPDALEIRHLQGWLWPYLTNVYVAKEGSFAIPYISHFWTLAVEEHFYLFWPFVVGLMSRAAAMRTCIVLSAVAVALRVAAHFAHLNIYYADVLTPFRLDSLCIGSWLALAACAPSGLAGLASKAKPALALAAAGVLATSAWHSKFGGEGTVAEALRQLFLALFFGWTLVLVSSADGPAAVKSFLRLKALREFGKYSYGLYVFHGILAYYFAKFQTLRFFSGLVGSQTVGWFLQALVGAVASTLVAIASYELFEAPFLRLKRYFPSSRPSSSMPSPVAPLVGPPGND
ncbi:MAG: acyltransferase [Polyangiaceae bacterium]